jgi:hypothetical protein
VLVVLVFNGHSKGGITMKKIFILSMLLVLSCGYASGGEIIRLTNNSYFDVSPIVNSNGNVYWLQFRQQQDGNSHPYVMYYNGVNIGDMGEGRFEYQPTVLEGNKLVYEKGPDQDNREIYLFDGNTEIRITNNSYGDKSPSMCNGYIVWVGAPNPEGLTDVSLALEIYLYKPDQPTTVNMSSLKVTPSDKKVKLEWQTEAEIDNVGFNVWRAEGFQKVNESMIPAEGSPIMGADYDFFDKWVMNGKLYYYLVEDIDNNGISTFHGPVKATPRWIYGIGK